MHEETDLARAFEELARDVHVRPGLKGDVERRLRRRRSQRRGRVAAGVLVAVGSLAVIVPMLGNRSDGTDLWVSSDGQDRTETDGAGSEPGAVSVVLEGVHDGDRWQLEAYDSSHGLCVDLRYQGDAGGGCGLDEAQRAVGWSRGRRGGVEAVFGTARFDVATIDVIRASGETLSFAPVADANEFEVGFYAFMVDASDPIMTVIARGVSGAELARLALPDPTSQREGFTGNVTDCEPPVHPVPDRATRQVVEVALTCGDGVVGDLRLVPRVVPADDTPLSAAVTELLSGPTAQEVGAGFSSAFSSDTARMLRSVDIDGSIAVLDFDAGFAGVNNFSTSALSLIVMSQIEATVFQFPEITGLDLRLDGERWCGWENPCEGAPTPLRTRQAFEAERERQVAAAAERTSTSAGD